MRSVMLSSTAPWHRKTSISFETMLACSYSFSDVVGLRPSSSMSRVNVPDCLNRAGIGATHASSPREHP